MMKYIETYKIFENSRIRQSYERNEEYQFLEPDVEKMLKEYLLDDIKEEVENTKLTTFQQIYDGSFDYDALKPYGTPYLQNIGKNFLYEKNIDYTTPAFLNSLNKIIDEVSEEENIFKSFDDTIITYFEKNPKDWLKIYDLYDFRDEVKNKLKYILNLDKFDI